MRTRRSVGGFVSIRTSEAPLTADGLGLYRAGLEGSSRRGAGSAQEDARQARPQVSLVPGHQRMVHRPVPAPGGLGHTGLKLPADVDATHSSRRRLRSSTTNFARTWLPPARLSARGRSTRSSARRAPCSTRPAALLRPPRSRTRSAPSRWRTPQRVARSLASLHAAPACTRSSLSTPSVCNQMSCNTRLPLRPMCTL